MAKSLDIGTMWLVKGEIDNLSEPVFTPERNVFLKAATTDDTESTLKENNWRYVKYGGDFYIVGEHALRLRSLLTVKSEPGSANIVATQVDDLRRPMKNGILNTAEEKLSIAIIQRLIADLLGPPSQPGENICFCSPSDPVNSSVSVAFHRTMLENFLNSLGYSVECIPEAMAIIYSERPVTIDPTDNSEAPFSGISISFGAGMANVVLSWRQMPLIAFSVCESGDWIDEQTAQMAGVDKSVVTRMKESNKFDVGNVDETDLVQSGLSFFYGQMVKNTLKQFSEKFNQLENQIDTPLEIVVAGGTALVKGFLDKFKYELGKQELPFQTKSVRLASSPLYAVSNGCLVKALSTEKKTKKPQQDQQKSKPKQA